MIETLELDNLSTRQGLSQCELGSTLDMKLSQCDSAQMYLSNVSSNPLASNTFERHC